MRSVRRQCGYREPDVVAHPFETDEEHHFALAVGEMAEGVIEFAQLSRSRGIGRGHERRSHLIDVDGRSFALRPPHVVDILVMHYREQPRAHVCTRLPEMGLGEPAHERILHEIVCPTAVPRECPRKAAQPRDLMLDEAVKFVHHDASVVVIVVDD